MVAAAVCDALLRGSRRQRHEPRCRYIPTVIGSSNTSKASVLRCCGTSQPIDLLAT